MFELQEEEKAFQTGPPDKDIFLGRPCFGQFLLLVALSLVVAVLFARFMRRKMFTI